MKIFHHNDNDGRAAAAMVNLFMDKERKTPLSKENFIEVDYGKYVPNASIVNNNEIVYIVDYSFTKQTFHLLQAIAEKTKRIYWFDHHKTSLEVEDYAKKICEYVELDINRSGAMIVYDKLVRGKIFDNDDIRRTITLVDDYDRWIHSTPDSMLFNNGSRLHNTHPLGKIWILNPQRAINEGKVIKKYRDITNNEITQRSSYTIKLNGHDCIVLNTPESSSQVFGDYYDKYKLAIRYCFNGRNYQYSIYSGLEDIDCSEIAKICNPNGGGHKGAAGFYSNILEFLPGVEYIFKNGKKRIRYSNFSD